MTLEEAVEEARYLVSDFRKFGNRGCTKRTVDAIDAVLAALEEWPKKWNATLDREARWVEKLRSAEQETAAARSARQKYEDIASDLRAALEEAQNKLNTDSQLFEIECLKAALMDALHDDALTADALIDQVAYTGEVRRAAERERDEALLAASVEAKEADRGRARVAALEAALERERLCWIEAIKRAVERGALSSTEEYRIHSDVGEGRARVQPAQGQEEGER